MSCPMLICSRIGKVAAGNVEVADSEYVDCRPSNLQVYLTTLLRRNLSFVS
jgi:hypothetical protein